MVDLTDPNPLVMTNFELVGFLCGLAGVAVAFVRSLVRRRQGGDRP